MTSVPMGSLTTAMPASAPVMSVAPGNGEDRFFDALLAFFADLPRDSQTAAPVVDARAPAAETQPGGGSDPAEDDPPEGDRFAAARFGPAMPVPAIGAPTQTATANPVVGEHAGREVAAPPVDPPVSPAAPPPVTRTAPPLVIANDTAPPTPLQSAAAPVNVGPTVADGASIAPETPPTAPAPAVIVTLDGESETPPAKVPIATMMTPPTIPTRGVAERRYPGAPPLRQNAVAPVSHAPTPAEHTPIAPGAISTAPAPAVVVILDEATEAPPASVPAATTDEGGETVPGRAQHEAFPMPDAVTQTKVHTPTKGGMPLPLNEVGETEKEARSPVAAAPPFRVRGRTPVGTGDAPPHDASHTLLSPVVAAGDTVHAAPVHHAPGVTAAPETASPVAVTSPVASERLTEVLSTEMLRAAPSGEHRLDITLHPPELGRVELSLVVGREMIHAHLVAHTEGARDLLTQHLAGLREQLVSQGFADPQLSVDLRHGSGERNWQRPNGGAQAAPRADTGHSLSPSTTPTPRRRDHRLFHRVA